MLGLLKKVWVVIVRKVGERRVVDEVFRVIGVRLGGF